MQKDKPARGAYFCRRNYKGDSMRKMLLLTSAGAMIAASTVAGFAQNSTQNKTPGHEMQQKGPAKGQPGASGYSPGHEMQKKGSKPGQLGASGYAPGHETMGQGTRRDTDRDNNRR